MPAQTITPELKKDLQLLKVITFTNASTFCSPCFLSLLPFMFSIICSLFGAYFMVPVVVLSLYTHDQFMSSIICSIFGAYFMILVVVLLLYTHDQFCLGELLCQKSMLFGFSRKCEIACPKQVLDILCFFI